MVFDVSKLLNIQCLKAVKVKAAQSRGVWEFKRFSVLLCLPGGFAQSELMSGHLIDFFVPFLPLEYRHIKLCARDAYAARGLETDEATLDEVAKAMLYVPKEERLFSAQGCKSIPQRINFFLP